MKVQWKTLLLKLIVWLATEILLNFLGTDDLANYTEFLFEDDNPVIVQQITYTYGVNYPVNHSLFSGDRFLLFTL